MGEVVGGDDHQPHSVQWNLVDAPLVVDAPQLGPVDPADGLDVGLVEEQSRAVVLTLGVLDDAMADFLVGVDGQRSSPAVAAGVADQPREGERRRARLPGGRR
jgi:hypothetical protein